jgi:major membrane immunogen (membrane-anchored lipoprotein)
MNRTLLAICALVLLAGCAASEFTMYKQKNSQAEWNITGSKTAITNTISIAINDSVVVADKPAAFANTIDAKGTYQGHEVHFFAVYNNGILGIFGTGWETTVLIDNELAARFKL